MRRLGVPFWGGRVFSFLPFLVSGSFLLQKLYRGELFEGRAFLAFCGGCPIGGFELRDFWNRTAGVPAAHFRGPPVRDTPKFFSERMRCDSKS